MNNDFCTGRDAMNPAEFFETSHFRENGEIVNSKPAIFFNGGLRMRKTTQIITLLAILALMLRPK